MAASQQLVVLSRVEPMHKLKLVELLKAQVGWGSSGGGGGGGGQSPGGTRARMRTHTHMHAWTCTS